MTRRLSFIRRLRRNKRGTALIEFALTAPVFLLLLMGVFDYCWQLYAKQVLQGAVSQAARLSTLESYADDQTALDARVEARVLEVFGHADVEFERLAYESFSDVGKPEPLSDNNGNGVWDPGECFEDLNSSGSWEADRGASGNGGADDVVLYRVSMTFDRVLPVWNMLGQPQEMTLTSSTVLRNQPYAADSSTSEVICK
ncbi:pilus assembly protein [Sphingopyxis sp. XHP0097]|uniref:Pilus assembly protein n=1 Tax=Sphingopyxis jiangsuensis TaxID=2871171 RepID=A0ABS7MDR1_9SPHN|nr:MULTISPECIES: TadE/TadG family type IV pilus assembly protein [Sphingopyxis]MBY4637162.1 pilus assembly protein [Sphingopyxis jiangsuensis]